MTNSKLIHDFVVYWTGKGYEKGESQPFWLDLHQDNDRAVMAAYGFDTRMSESDCVAKLLEMYQELTR